PPPKARVSPARVGFRAEGIVPQGIRLSLFVTASRVILSLAAWAGSHPAPAALTLPASWKNIPPPQEAGALSTPEAPGPIKGKVEDLFPSDPAPPRRPAASARPRRRG